MTLQRKVNAMKRLIQRGGLLHTLSLLTPTARGAENKLPVWALGPFVRPEGVNPIITPQETTFYCPLSDKEIPWENGDTFNPAATIKDGQVCILYRAEDQPGQGISRRTSRLGMAQSPDGVTISARSKTPVLFPAKDSQEANEWPGGCEDPRIAITEDGTYVCLYTQWNRKVAHLAVAFSKDLLTWEKFGPVFAKTCNGKYADLFCKSGSLVTTIKDGKLIITKVNGKYLMYWGEKAVYLATSTDLIHWDPMVDANQNLVPLVLPRNGFFDSIFTECGPPAVLTEKGIVLIYNGKNDGGENRDPNYTANAYCAGQLLFDSMEPCRVIDRLEKPFLIPEAPFEKSGQYPAGTVFVEGLVYHQSKWFLYYGCADSRVAVVVWEKK